MKIGLSSEQNQLEPMRIADSVIYDSYFDMPEKNMVRIKVQIDRSGGSVVVAA